MQSGSCKKLWSLVVWKQTPYRNFTWRSKNNFLGCCQCSRFIVSKEQQVLLNFLKRGEKSYVTSYWVATHCYFLLHHLKNTSAIPYSSDTVADNVKLPLLPNFFSISKVGDKVPEKNVKISDRYFVEMTDHKPFAEFYRALLPKWVDYLDDAFFIWEALLNLMLKRVAHAHVHNWCCCFCTSFLREIE